MVAVPISVPSKNDRSIDIFCEISTSQSAEEAAMMAIKISFCMYSLAFPSGTIRRTTRPAWYADYYVMRNFLLHTSCYASAVRCLAIGNTLAIAPTLTNANSQFTGAIPHAPSNVFTSSNQLDGVLAGCSFWKIVEFVVLIVAVIGLHASYILSCVLTTLIRRIYAGRQQQRCQPQHHINCFFSHVLSSYLGSEGYRSTPRRSLCLVA